MATVTKLLTISITLYKHENQMKEITNEAVFLGASTFFLPNQITQLEVDIIYTNVYTNSGKEQIIQQLFVQLNT
jgi:hypothetical protein